MPTEFVLNVLSFNKKNDKKGEISTLLKIGNA